MTKKKNIPKPKRSDKVPITMGVVLEFKEHIDRKVSELKNCHLKHDLRFKQIDLRFDEVDKRFDRVDARFDELEKKMDQRFDELKAEIHRLALVVEEQNARNKFVLDGYTQLYDLIQSRHFSN